MTLRLLSSGVDSLYLSANGGLKTALLGELEAAKVRARSEREPVPYEFAVTGWRLLLKPGGFGGYAYWLTSPELELWLGRERDKGGPMARVQLHSLYLHRVGPVSGLEAVRVLLEQDVCAGPPMLSVSRLDVYADAQGWRLEPADLDRFVTRANHRVLRADGRRFTGFTFGTRRAGLLARLYDKDAQMEERGLTWMRAYWRGRVESERVWRLEFELRREFMRRLATREPGAVLERVAALWQRCTGDWLTLRTPSEHAVNARWPLDPAWVEAQGLLGAVQEGRELVWQAAEEANEERVLAVLQGSFTTWAAMLGIADKECAGRAMVLRTDRYLARTGRTFESEVRRKRERLQARGVRRAVLSRRVHLTGLPKPGSAVGGPKAQEGESVPRIGRSARTARRARVGQSTFWGRPPKDTTGADSGGDRTISAARVSGGESERGWLEAETSGEAVNRRGDGGQGDALRDETRRPRETEGERKQPGEGGRAHERGHEDDGGGRGDGGGRAMAPVGAEPPTQPGGYKPNRSKGGRVGARQRVRAVRGAAGGRGRSKPRRGHARRRWVSSDGMDGAGAP